MCSDYFNASQLYTLVVSDVMKQRNCSKNVDLKGVSLGFSEKRGL